MNDVEITLLRNTIFTNLQDYDYYFCSSSFTSDTNRSYLCWFTNNITNVDDNRFTIEGYDYCVLNLVYGSSTPYSCSTYETDSRIINFRSTSSAYRFTNYDTNFMNIVSDISYQKNESIYNFDNWFGLFALLLTIPILSKFLFSMFKRS